MKKSIKKNVRPVYHRLRNILAFCKSLYKYKQDQRLSEVQKVFARNLSFFKASVPKRNVRGILLVQMVKDYQFTVKLAAASKSLAEKNSWAVSFYEVDIDYIWERNKETFVYEHLFATPLEQIHAAFGGPVIFSNSEKFKDQTFIQRRLKETLNELNNDVQALLNLRFENVLVGDLIYDTYLRFFHKATVKEFDNDLIHTIEIALNVFYNFKSFLSAFEVKGLLNTYSTYIHHGIPARICINEGIKVYTVGYSNYKIQELNIEFPYHQINHTKFSADKKLSAEQLAFAHTALTSRFSGKIDAAISYMRKSAYFDAPPNEELRTLLSKRGRNIVIYAHDFYDSPHVNRLLQFPDLFLWLQGTLRSLTELKETSVFIKAHPNGISDCREKTFEVVNQFHKDYFYVLDESVSNSDIIKLKPDLIITARGTIGMEMAWFEIPVVALYDNIYANFNFVHTSPTIGNYLAVIRGEIQPEIDFDKRKICSFYYQAFIEQVGEKENPGIKTLRAFGGNTYNEEYLKFINSEAATIFNEEFISFYNV